MTTETIDRLPHGWIVVDICKRQPRSREWVALVTEADPATSPTRGQPGFKSPASIGPDRLRGMRWRQPAPHAIDRAALKLMRMVLHGCPVRLC